MRYENHRYRRLRKAHPDAVVRRFRDVGEKEIRTMEKKKTEEKIRTSRMDEDREETPASH